VKARAAGGWREGWEVARAGWDGLLGWAGLKRVESVQPNPELIDEASGLIAWLLATPLLKRSVDIAWGFLQALRPYGWKSSRRNGPVSVATCCAGHSIGQARPVSAA
jgi:hypothetical protein